MHYRWNDETSVWGQRGGVGDTCQSDPALTSLPGNELLCVYVKAESGNQLYYSLWTEIDEWSLPASCNGELSWGCPALFTLTADGTTQAYCVFAANNQNRHLISLVYDSARHIWTRAGSNPDESTAFEIKKTFYNDQAFVSFQENNENTNYVSNFSQGTWSGHESIGEISADTPTVCAYNGYLNCFLNAPNNSRTFLWLQRPLLGFRMSSWMSKIADDTLLSNLTIPGTHDSAAIGSLVPYASAQTMSIPQQLNSGIRYFDLRCKEENLILDMYHGPVSLGTTLSQVLILIKGFLAQNPTETIIAQIKDEAYTPSPNFAAAFQAILDQSFFGQLFALGVETPKLGNVRGKIQLVRRFSSPTSIGIDVSSGWQNNNANFQIITPGGVALIIQDEYNPEGSFSDVINKKISDTQSMLLQAKNDANPANWYLNFSSAYITANLGTPAFVAKGRADQQGVNSLLETWISGQTSSARWGVVLFNFLETPDDIIIRLVMFNSFVISVKLFTNAIDETDLGLVNPKTVPALVDDHCSRCENASNEKLIKTLECFTDALNHYKPALEHFLKHYA